MTRLLLLVAPLLAQIHGLRKWVSTRSLGATSANGAEPLDGNVAALYTWGAPMTVQPIPSNPRSADGCWPGLRMFNVNEKGLLSQVDPVPPILRVSAWLGHPKMAAARINEDGNITRMECGWIGVEVQTPLISLHMARAYIERWGSVSNTEDAWISELSNIAIRPSYLYGADEVAEYIRPFGWRIAGSAHENEKVSHLLQKPSTLDCVITFQGTKSPQDWWDNLQFVTAPFCGLPMSVHQGFRSQTRWMTQNPQWQANIRAKLGKCSRVFATGHSLGGAMATLFTMCIAQAPPKGVRGHIDFKRLGWHQETPELLTPFDPKK